jgi:hypothetical protein
MRAADRVELGPAPRANLLPPEVHRDASARRARRLMVYLVILVAVAVVGGYAFASISAAAQQAQLAQAKAHTQELINERQQYGEVTALTSIIETIEVARGLATTSEVLWATQLGDVLSIMPPGSTINNIDASARAPWGAEMATTGPLRQPRIATILLKVSSPTVPDGIAIVRAAEKFDWIADISIERIEGVDGLYSTSFTMNVNDEALAARFAEDSEGGEDDD